MFLEIGQSVNFNELQEKFEMQSILSSDILYSEMVATFTGIPTYMKAEAFWQQFTNNQMLNFDRLGIGQYMQESKHGLYGNEGLTTLHEQLLKIWQIYNSYSYSLQLKVLMPLLSKNGRIAVITDTLKKFDDTTITSRPSFVGPFPSQPKELDEVFIGFNEEIWWKDEIHSEKSVTGIDSLKSHSHFVETRVYKINNQYRPPNIL